MFTLQSLETIFIPVLVSIAEDSSPGKDFVDTTTRF